MSYIRASISMRDKGEIDIGKQLVTLPLVHSTLASVHQFLLLKITDWDFPCGLVLRELPMHRVAGLIPSQETRFHMQRRPGAVK